MRAPHTHSRSPRVIRGLTVVELLTVLAIVAVLTVAAGPSLSDGIAAQRLRAAGTDLVSTLLMARSEAIKRNTSTMVRPSTGDDWSAGWMTETAGGEQIDRRPPPGTRVLVTEAPDAVVYGPTGRLQDAGTARFEFVDAHGRPGITPRCVTVDMAGLPRLAVQPCP